MIKRTKPFGYSVYGYTLGEMWLSLIELVLRYGGDSMDEGRHRLAVQNVRVKALTQKTPDELIGRFGSHTNLQEMLKLTFKEREMRDIDVIPSFSPGAKSYFHRLEEGRLVEFVIKRLSTIPESKKAVIVFPTYEDYRAVLKNPKNDYLPCVVSIQFRLMKEREGWVLNTTFYMRSLDVLQKAHGNFVAMAILSQNIARKLSRNLRYKVHCGFLDGLIADAHIYSETILSAKAIVAKAGKCL